MAHDLTNYDHDELGESHQHPGKSVSDVNFNFCTKGNIRCEYRLDWRCHFVWIEQNGKKYFCPIDIIDKCPKLKDVSVSELEEKIDELRRNELCTSNTLGKTQFTKGPLEVVVVRDNPDVYPTVDAMKKFMAETVDATINLCKNIPDLYVVMIHEGCYTCITGNGPTSRADAYLYAAAAKLYETVEFFVEKSKEQGHDVTALEKLLAEARGEE